MGNITLTDEDWDFLKKMQKDVQELIAERNKYKNLYESYRNAAVEFEAKTLAALLTMAREIEIKVPGIEFDTLRCELMG